MQRKVRNVLMGGFMVLSGGCHNQPKTVAGAPATTQTACAQVRDFFVRHSEPFKGPEDMSSGCQFRVMGPRSLPRDLGRELAANGWKQDQTAWVTPSTRCAMEESPATAHPGVHGGVGVSGGTHLGPSFGFGLSIGSFGESALNYMIDCLPR